MSVVDVLSQLPYLSKEELRAVIEKSHYFLSLNRRVVSKAPVSEMVVNSPFVEPLLLYAKKYVLVPDWLKDDYVERLNLISKELESVSNQIHLDRRERIRLCGVLLDAAICNLKERKRDLSFRTLLFALTDPKSTLMEAYPGYFGTTFFRQKVLNEKAKPIQPGERARPPVLG
jgi:hypothetical protein